MTLDLKAKAESIAGSFMPSSTGVDGWQRDRKELAVEIEGALKEVQSATREETIRECAEIAEQGVIYIPDILSATDREAAESYEAERIRNRIRDLLTTPGRNERKSDLSVV